MNLENFERFEDNGINGYRVKAWGKKGLLHGFLDRSFDVRKYKAAVVEKPLMLGAAPLCLLKQTHSCDLHNPDNLLIPGSDPSIVPTGDGWLTQSEQSRSAILGIQTADCVPVLIVGEGSNKLYPRAALHCGWRGAVAGILQRALAELGSIQDLAIAIGPGAGSCCYEVEEDVVSQFARVCEKHQIDQSSAIKSRLGKRYADIQGLLAGIAANLGIPQKRIYGFSGCTICDKSFFSYRREKELSGRQLSFMAS